MDFSLGFLVALFLVVFPGLLLRRLYYYGEFSKEFKSNYSILQLVGLACIPGIALLIVFYLFYDLFFVNIDLESLIDFLKDVDNPAYKLSSSTNISLEESLRHDVLPFVLFLYLTSLLVGLISGRLVRIAKLDLRFKVLRFRNNWFYLFSGEYFGFKKSRHLIKHKKIHVFTKVDVLIDSGDERLLYSGIVVDYELDDKNCRELNTLILRNAKRYKLIDDVKSPIDIPGNIFAVNCKNMVNLNLVYVYEDPENLKSIMESKIPYYVDISFSVLAVMLIPLFIFRSDSIDLDIYIKFFDQSGFKKLISYFFVLQLIALFNPFIKIKGTYKRVGWKIFGLKVLLISFLGFILWL